MELVAIIALVGSHQYQTSTDAMEWSWCKMCEVSDFTRTFFLVAFEN